jgi:LDH2 family malate/lactate/ureidoglycolate dehydrogenase
MLGLLGGVLNGAAFGRDVIDFNYSQEGATNTGQFMVAIDIARFVPLATFTAETDRHLADLRASKRLPGVDHIRLPGDRRRACRVERLPGDRRRACRVERLRDGIPLPTALLGHLDRLAGELGVRKLREWAA